MNLAKQNKANKPVVFVEGLRPHHGVALYERGGVWRVRVGRRMVDVWEEDIFDNTTDAQRAINLILN